MKRLLAATLMLGLAACGGEGPSPTPMTSSMKYPGFVEAPPFLCRTVVCPLCEDPHDFEWDEAPGLAFGYAPCTLHEAIEQAENDRQAHVVTDE